MLETPVFTGLVARETTQEDSQNGRQEKGQGRQVLAPMARVHVDSRRLPPPMDPGAVCDERLI